MNAVARSKFVAEDSPLFLSLIGDLWPGIQAAKAVFPDIEAAMKSESAKMNLQYDKAENWSRALPFCLHCLFSLLSSGVQ